MRVEPHPGRREQVVERLRLAIATGHFKPGARLIERELCELTGVSRTSLREALRELQSEGLITAQPNRGLTVTVITPEAAESIYQVRAVLEALAARLFVRHASDAQVTELRRSVERLAKVYANYTPEGFLSAKTGFYQVLLDGAGNQTVTNMLQQVHVRASQLRVTSLSNPSRAKKSIAEIRRFVAAIEARDEDAAWQLCMVHVENAGHAALAILRNSKK